MLKNILDVGTTGVDMLSEPLTLDNKKAHFTLNMAHDENRLQTRSGFRYHNLGLTGKYLGSTYHHPKYGLSAKNPSEVKSSLVIALNTGVFSVVVEGDEFWDARALGTPAYQTETFLYTAENYLVILSPEHQTVWSSDMFRFHCSPGTTLCSNGESYENFINEEFEHFLPNNASVGAFVHGRNEISVDVGCNNSYLLSSDLLGKRKCPENTDILLMEEEAKMSTPLSAGSEFGRTIALMIMPVNDLNGEGVLFDFREGGVVEHNTLLPRESRWAKNGEGILVKIKEGWDTQRITRVRLNHITAVSRYAVTKLPNDILFRSQFGLHFMKFVLGQGTLNDETVNVISQDVEPLLKLDEDYSGATTGHWIAGNRFLATTGLEKRDSNVNSTSSAFVVMNQAMTYTEDRTPRPVWEGAWKTDDGIDGIHQFTQASHRPRGLKDDRYGFIASDELLQVYYSQFDEKLRGYDFRDGEQIPIKSKYISGQFPFSGTTAYDIITNGYLEFEYDGSSSEVIVSVRTEASGWIEWHRKTLAKGARGWFSPLRLGEPPSAARRGSYFQFKIEMTGWFKLLSFNVEYKQDKLKTEGSEDCRLSDETEENYLAYEH